ncbi:hypothetical protein FJR03_06760 [Sulfurimonas marina]|uniref:Uncharacterized protein n=2 Tax=Sulfurimonas marina TaxID=2590551 RepID=A0A7M1AVL5_9BACT|nr:hypothetical protein FJR03_06760 [Sulfurimonas marina]
MGDEDYFYSLIYHSKIQKYEVKEVYKTRFYSLAKSLNIKDYDINSIENEQYIANLLNCFMKNNHYNFSVPLDINVPKNKLFFALLDQNIREGYTYKTPNFISIMNYTPNWILKIMPQWLKSIVKKIVR